MGPLTALVGSPLLVRVSMRILLWILCNLFGGNWKIFRLLPFKSPVMHSWPTENAIFLMDCTCQNWEWLVGPSIDWMWLVGPSLDWRSISHFNSSVGYFLNLSRHYLIMKDIKYVVVSCVYLLLPLQCLWVLETRLVCFPLLYISQCHFWGFASSIGCIFLVLYNYMLMPTFLCNLFTTINCKKKKESKKWEKILQI